MLTHVANGRFPFIATVRSESGLAHFVTVWSRVGGYFQVMDPRGGRQWTRVEDFVEELYLHRHIMPGADWADWARHSSFGDALRARLNSIVGVDSSREFEKYWSD